MRCKLHGQEALIKDHIQICPYQFCDCYKCSNFTYNNMATNRKNLVGDKEKHFHQKLQPEHTNIVDFQPLPHSINQIRQSSSHRVTEKFLQFNQVTLQPPLEPYKKPYQTSRDNSQECSVSIQSSQDNPTTMPKNTFRLLCHPSSENFLSTETSTNRLANVTQLNSSSINSFDFIFSNFETIDLNDNEQLRQMLLMQSFMITNFILGSANK